MFSKRQAQAAIEFLTTYGWSLLALSAVLGVMAYFGVFSADARVPSQCAFDEAFECTAYIAQEDGSFAFELVSQVSGEVNISKVLCEFPRSDKGVLINLSEGDLEYTLARGDNITISCDYTLLDSDGLGLRKKDRFQAKIIYHDNVAGSLPDIATADIVSNVVTDRSDYNDYYDVFGSIRCDDYSCRDWDI